MDMKPKVFIERSIFKYSTVRLRRDAADTARHLLSVAWWQKEASNFDMFTLASAEGKYGETLGDCAPEIPEVETSSEVHELADALQAGDVLPGASEIDLLHISAATVHSADFLMTWKVDTIANARYRKQIARSLNSWGYKRPEICTPEQLTQGGDLISDPIIEEVRRIRVEFCQEFNYDISAMAEYFRKKEQGP